MTIRVTLLPHFRHILEQHSPIYSSGTPRRNAFSVQYSSKTPYKSAFFPRASSCHANAARLPRVLFRQLSVLPAARARLLKAASASDRSSTRWLSLVPGRGVHQQQQHHHVLSKLGEDGCGRAACSWVDKLTTVSVEIEGRG
ncbi:hypothetical protein E1301_Tti018645 [Triplophysa tibetana]|uniref:Uncharacterized protein n=1 Tax=Triplophysa tibetana TaxID=1572043 RepID=A0A5A9NTM5_9TELE|nr:hypothetical protein E1301_Tti018645 [Triplophysa tibetana]